MTPQINTDNPAIRGRVKKRQGQLLTRSDIADRGFLELASCDPLWTLYTRPDASSKRWTGLYLRLWDAPQSRKHKVSFWLEWNRERFSKNPAAQSLEQQYPEIFEAVTKLLSDIPDTPDEAVFDL